MLFDVALRYQMAGRPLAVRFVSHAGITALVGPSGAGKTTVLNAVAGLVKPDAGRICVNGRVLFDTENAINMPPEQRRCGYVFQDSRLFPHMSVAKNLAYGARRSRQRGAGQNWPDQAEIVELLGIGALLGRWPAHLSGGEAKRVAIGRALLCAPEFLLLDEPLASLDEARANAMMGLIERIRDTLHLPILLVSHDRREVDRLAQTIVPLAHLG